jgi:delta(3,5)-delta(2,4)-dienoyl-CoA isomerase
LGLSGKHLNEVELNLGFFLSRVFDTREAVLEAAISLASVIARKSPIAVQGSKINLNYARDHTVDDNFIFTVNKLN